ncbi:hypothetical protein SARC_18177, partial [Sphaeroforma arctica JP610]
TAQALYHISHLSSLNMRQLRPSFTTRWRSHMTPHPLRSRRRTTKRHRAHILTKTLGMKQPRQNSKWYACSWVLVHVGHHTSCLLLWLALFWEAH